MSKVFEELVSLKLDRTSNEIEIIGLVPGGESSTRPTKIHSGSDPVSLVYKPVCSQIYNDTSITSIKIYSN